MYAAEHIPVKWDSSLYDMQHDFVFKYGEDLVALLQPQQGERILDAGCGTGYLAHRMAESGAEVTGIDSSADMISKAKAAYPGLHFQQASITSYQVLHQYDAIFCNAVLHWIKEKEKAAANLYRNLKPGGRLVLEMGGKDNVAGIIHALTSTLALYGYKKQAAIVQWYFPSLSEYTSLLEKTGFTVSYAAYFDRPTPLKDTEHGIAEWLAMFAAAYFEGIQEKDRAVILKNVEGHLAPAHFRDGVWYADYKRLRIVAIKEKKY